MSVREDMYNVLEQMMQKAETLLSTSPDDLETYVSYTELALEFAKLYSSLQAVIYIPREESEKYHQCRMAIDDAILSTRWRALDKPKERLDNLPEPEQAVQIMRQRFSELTAMVSA